jgi:hypothetical protein
MFTRLSLSALFIVLFLISCKKEKTPSDFIVVDFQNGLAPYTSYTGCQDANMASGAAYANNNFGSCAEGSMGYVDASQGITRYLVQFDISYIPKGVTIKKAFLTLYASNNVASTGNETISCYNKTTPWQAGINCNLPGGISYTSSNGGGSFDPASVGSVVISPGNNNYSFNISPSTVQNWLDNSTKNYGLLLKSNNESTSSYLWCNFADNPTVNLRPKLTVYYTIE